ncbi:MAG: DUF1624 domain-containing protein [Chitinophagaceae bacterium]|nr:DUF1624 domain-containing protein [Chitinophagaceae bacterium]
MKRIQFLDLARGGTVLMMAPVHTALLYSFPTIYETVLIKFLSFMAEGPGAQLFMTLMGIYIGLAQDTDFVKTFKRSALLMLGGYALNVVKFVIPLCLGVLPAEMLHHLEITGSNMAVNAIQLLLIGDIFHFAAIALILTTLIKRYVYHNAYIVVIIIAITTIAPWCWDNTSHNAVINYLLQLTGGHPPRVYFPVFPWLVYPLTGLIIGKNLKRDERGTIEQTVIFSFILLGIYSSYRMIYPAAEDINFYRTEWPETIQHTGIVGIALFVYYKVNQLIPDNRVFQFLAYSGRNITRLYVVQWIVIMFCLPIAGYQDLGVKGTIIGIVVMTGVSYGINYVIEECKRIKYDNVKKMW